MKKDLVREVREEPKRKTLFPSDVKTKEDFVSFLDEAKIRHEAFMRYWKSTPLYRHTKHETPVYTEAYKRQRDKRVISLLLSYSR